MQRKHIEGATSVMSAAQDAFPFSDSAMCSGSFFWSHPRSLLLLPSSEGSAGVGVGGRDDPGRPSSYGISAARATITGASLATRSL